MVFKINIDGVIEFQEVYNGTDSGWALVFKMELQYSTPPIPGFLIFPAISILSIVITISFLKKDRN